MIEERIKRGKTDLGVLVLGTHERLGEKSPVYILSPVELEEIGQLKELEIDFQAKKAE